MVNFKDTLPSFLCISTSLESIIIHYFLSHKPRVNYKLIVFFAECLKLILSILLFYKFKEHEEKLKFKNILWFSLPAFLYAIGNVATLMSLKIINASMFSLLITSKIPIVVIFGFICLRHDINSLKIVSAMLMTLGNFIPYTIEDISVFEYIGIFYGLVYILCSCIATIYNEYILQTKMVHESVFAQNIKFYTCGIAVNLILCIVNYKECLEYSLDLSTVPVITAMSVAGIVTSLVIRYHGSVIKVYSTSASIFLTTLIEALFFSYKFSIMFYIGAIICVIGIFLFFKSLEDNTNTEELVSLIESTDEDYTSATSQSDVEV